MGMIIYNNTAALFALNENKKNEKGLAKTLKKAASGMKLNSAGDDASGYSISEKLRVKLRALDQNDRNVKNGTALLQTASGAVQEQVSLLKTIRQKVIDANNDTNTEADRATIQKEIDQYYDQMSDIVYNTEYNGEKILMGNAVAESVTSWDILGTPVLAENSEIEGLFPDLQFDSLDGQLGPFATFGKETDSPRWDGYKEDLVVPSDIVGTDVNPRGTRMSGGKENELTIDLSAYSFSSNDKTALADMAFKITYPTNNNQYHDDIVFVLTTDKTKKYAEAGNKATNIDISSCSSVNDVANAIKDAINKTAGVKDGYDVQVENGKVILTTKSSGFPHSDANSDEYYNVEGLQLKSVTYHPQTSWFGSDGKLRGGTNAVYETVTTTTKPSDSDASPGQSTSYHLVTAATQAKVDIPRSSATFASTALTIHYCEQGEKQVHGYRYDKPAVGYLIFENGNGCRYDKDTNCYYVGKDYEGTFGEEMNMTISLTAGNMTATANVGDYASDGNGFYIEDGIEGYDAASQLEGISNAKSGERAYWDIDLSGYSTSDVEQVISNCLGKALYGYAYSLHEFIDTGSTSGMDAICKCYSSPIDLNDVREAVSKGKSVAEAFADVMNKGMGSSTLLGADGKTVTGVRFYASVAGEAGNSEYMYEKKGELRHYTIDWQNWADTQGITDIPAALHEKGFRFYCATDSSQWVNVRFINGKDSLDDDRPGSGNAANNIKTVTIDVEGIDNISDLVSKINDDLGNYLQNVYKHNFNITFDSQNGTTTIYDERRHTVMVNGTTNSRYPNQQEKGAKIGSGLLDNVMKSTRDIYVNDLVIQHTDKSNMNIHVKIPQTSLDQIFGYKEGSHHISEYNVMTKEMREKLLGVPPDKGILDKGVDYLLDAQTLIGAQIVHMEIADDNITAQ